MIGIKTAKENLFGFAAARMLSGDNAGDNAE